MLNILIPMGGKSLFFDEQEYPFPKPLIEINGRSMIELVIGNLGSIRGDKKFLFVVNSADCNKYHLDNVLNLLTDGRCGIIRLDNQTKGAACSCLMAIEHVDNDDPLVISNADQVISADLNAVIKRFEDRKVDAGVVCFESVHPRWSFVRLDENGKIIETAEKRPISKNAIAGFYYFRHGKYFVEATMASIKKDASVDGSYFIAPTFNELVLKNRNLEIARIGNQEYHTFYSPQKIKEYEKKTGDGND